MTTLAGLLNSLVTAVVRYQQLRGAEEASIVREIIAKPKADMISELNRIVLESTQIIDTRRPLLGYLLLHIEILRGLEESTELYTESALEMINASLTQFVVNLQTLYKLKKTEFIPITENERGEYPLYGFITPFPVINLMEFYSRSATILLNTLFKEIACDQDTAREQVAKNLESMLLAKWNKLRADAYASRISIYESRISALESTNHQLQQQVVQLQQEQVLASVPSTSFAPSASHSSAASEDDDDDEQRVAADTPEETSAKHRQAKKSFFDHFAFWRSNKNKAPHSAAVDDAMRNAL